MAELVRTNDSRFALCDRGAADRRRKSPTTSLTATRAVSTGSSKFLSLYPYSPGSAHPNHKIHIAAATQIRLDTPGRAYYRRKLAAGKTRAEAMRRLKRRISDALYRQLLADARRQAANGTEMGDRECRKPLSQRLLRAHNENVLL